MKMINKCMKSTRNAWYKVLVGHNVWMLLVLVLVASGCKKEPVNRDIEGHWKLLQFTVLESGEVVTCKRLFYGITHKITKVMEKQGEHGNRTYSALTEYRDNESVLVLKDFKSGIDASSNPIDTPVEKLLPFGINNQKETVFSVLESSHKRMVLESDYARLELKKF